MSKQKKRGRGAEFPGRIPPKGWKDILLRVKNGFVQDRLSIAASGAAFFVFLSVIPMIIATISVYGIISDPQQVHEHIQSLNTFIPDPIGKFLEDEFVRITDTSDFSLSWGFILSVIVAIYSVSVGMKSLISALNIAYNESESRSFIKLNAIGLLFAMGSILIMIIFLVFIMALPTIVEYYIETEFMKNLALIGRWILAGLLCIFSLGLVYKLGPKRRDAEWIWVSWGSILSTILLIIASYLFSLYIQNLNSYNATYGSLASAVIFMLWLYYSMLIILIGAKLNAEMEHQTKLDTTVGEDREMGNRGAHVADTLGRKYSTSDDVDESE